MKRILIILFTLLFFNSFSQRVEKIEPNIDFKLNNFFIQNDRAYWFSISGISFTGLAIIANRYENKIGDKNYSRTYFFGTIAVGLITTSLVLKIDSKNRLITRY